MSTNPWEASAEWMRQQPDLKQLTIDCYMEEDIGAAAERFSQSEEFGEVRKWAVDHGLPQGGRIIDIGSGNGISAYAWAAAGYRVVALEPNPGDSTGAGAIRRLSSQTGVPIEVYQEYGERTGLAADSFDLAYCREVLHHAADLNQLCHEAYRILCPGGIMIATREHVISRPEQLPQFLQNHPTHWLTGTEMAYPLTVYKRALRQAGFRILGTYGPMDTVVNYYPASRAAANAQALRSAKAHLGGFIGSLVGRTALWHAFWRAWYRRFGSPGRLFSFIALKPAKGNTGGPFH